MAIIQTTTQATAKYKSTRHSIVKNTAKVGLWTIISRILGMVREQLIFHYQIPGEITDSFIAACAIPNSLRKIFAEGLFSAVMIPIIARADTKDKHPQFIGNLMATAALIFQGMTFITCAIIVWKADFITYCSIPGKSAEQIYCTAQLLRIMIPFAFLLSCSALLASGLQAAGHFSIPACTSVILNITSITGLFICISYKLPIQALCITYLFGSFLVLIAHIMAYRQLSYGIGYITKESFIATIPAVKRFFPTLIAMAPTEINLFIDRQFASFLPSGSLSIVYLAERFMEIPRGVFANALSTTLLPQLSQISQRAPKRLGYYLLEATQFIWWVTLPTTIIMSFFATKIFTTFFFSNTTDITMAVKAGIVLQIYLAGLFFLSLDRVTRSLFYALQATWVPSAVIACASMLHLALNFVLFKHLGIFGLVIASTTASTIGTIIMLTILKVKFNIPLYFVRFIIFALKVCWQCLLHVCGFLILYHTGLVCIQQLSASLQYVLQHSILFWLWVGPLTTCVATSYWYSKDYFGIHINMLRR